MAYKDSKRLYSDLSGICHDFYRRYFPHEKIAANITRVLKKHSCKKIVFIGGLLYVARILEQRGFDITFVDYTPEMLAEAKPILKKCRFMLADMRKLRVPSKVDAVVAMGRSFTYMYTDADALKTLNAFKRAVKKDGIIIFDNYEIGKMDKRAYFTGTLKTGQNGQTILRHSRIKRVKRHPAIYRWHAVYEKIGRRHEEFQDPNHLLRAFSKKELEGLIAKAGLRFLAHKNNFERRSYITVAQKN